MSRSASIRVFVACFLLLAATANATTIYVSTAGLDANDGLSWATAKRTVQAGLNAAQPADQVWVASGTYIQMITLKAGVALYGGFSGSETDISQRNWRTNVTTLDGYFSGSVVTVPSGATAATRIDGFAICNGSKTSSPNGSYGAGIYCSNASPTIANNTITANTCVSGSESRGGAIYCYGSSAAILGNVITSNAAGYGGGIYCESSSATIANNVIAGNGATFNGGGILCDRSNLTIANNTVASNMASFGGGIYAGNGAVTITNTIVAFNTSGIILSGSGPLTIRRCCVYGNTAGNYFGLADPTGINGNISVDPKLAAVGFGNLHVQPDSLCLNAGDNSSVQAGWTDVDGQSRILGGQVDIGADESDETLWPSEPSLIVRVATDGNDANDGSSWAAAKRTVQGGVNATASSGGEVWVKAGTYQECVTLRNYVHVYGGFAGTEMQRSDRNWTQSVTVVDGNLAGSVVTANAPGYLLSTIDGFTIRNGCGTSFSSGSLRHGGGIYCIASSPCIANNTITANDAHGSSQGFGGGIYCNSCQPLITNNTITGNTGESFGGGIYCFYASPTITENRITNNVASYNTGGAIYCDSMSNPTISSNTITGNRGNSVGGIYCASTLSITGNTISSNFGCGIYCSSGSPSITNNTIAGNDASSYKGGGIVSGSVSSPLIRGNTIIGNKAYQGAGIYWTAGSPTITNNTITGNSTTNDPSLAYGGGLSCASASGATIADNIITNNTAFLGGGGIHCSAGSPLITNNTIAGNNAPAGGGIYRSAGSPTIVNTIIAYNSSGVYQTGSGTTTLRSNCVYGNFSYNYAGLTDPTGMAGNLSVDPKLAQPFYANVHIQPDSPCVDAGDDSVVQSDWTDMDGQPRKQGAHVDLGADESDGTVWPTAPGAIIRVSPQGNDANDGSSWPQAKRTVQASINAIASTGGQVWVAAGTYVENVTVGLGIALYGGFAGTETDLSQRDWTVNPTILDGNRRSSVITASPGVTANTRIDGFTIRNGQADYGAGICCYGSSCPTITNNTITGNNNNYSGGKGGGICCVSSSPMIVANAITGNRASTGGEIYCGSSSSPTITNNTIAGSYGGSEIYCSASSPTITGNKISANGSSGNGGGIYCTASSSPMIVSNTISGNMASTGGAIYCDSSSCPTVTGNTITGNTGSYGGGIYCSQSSPTIINNTILGNSATGTSGAGYGGGIGCYGSGCSPMIANNVISGNSASYGGGIHCDSSSSPTIVNNTITGNGAPNGGAMYCTYSSHPTIANTLIAFNSSGICVAQSAAPSLRFNCVFGNGTCNYSGLADPTGGNGNISIDPKLASVPYGNIHVQPDSPCIDAGDSSIAQPTWTDMDGQARRQGAGVDIGADESAGTLWPSGPYIIIRVADNGNDANDGLTWVLPKRTVQAAIDAAAAAGGDVWVKAGVYMERISLRNHVHVYGGFAGSESQRTDRQPIQNATILDGNTSGVVVTAAKLGHQLSTIDGFVIRNGSGISCSTASPTVANNTITGHVAYDGVIACTSSTAMIANNRITGNRGSNSGAIYCYWAAPTIAGNTILNNTTSAQGGGILCGTSSSPTIANNVISGNCASSSGGGIACVSATPTIINNAIVDNAASSDGGGIYCSSSSATIVNNTIVSNSANNGGAISCYSSSPTIVNTVLAFNSSGLRNISGGVPVLRSNCVYGNAAYNCSGLTDPTGTNGNISADPKLAGLSYGSPHIQSDSRCIDAGEDTIVQASWLDIDGGTRIAGSHVDIGADEFDGTIWAGGPNTIIRVNSSGSDTNDGSSWGLAKRTVQAAIDAAAAVGGEVWVQAGTYPERITLRSFVHVYGGFAGSEMQGSDRDWARNMTVLDGGQAGSVVTASNAGYLTSTLDGFTIRNGSASTGGGIYCSLSSPTFAHNAISGNMSAASGGGMYISCGLPAIIDSTITGNSASDGGGLYCYSSSPTIANSTMVRNKALSNGGAIFSNSSSPVITSTILAFNSSGLYKYGSGVPSVRYSCVFGNAAYNYSGMTDPTGTNGNLRVDPQFLRTPNAGPDGKWATADDSPGDLHLRFGSLCIDGGDPAFIPTLSEKDLDGGPRKIDSRVDMGAYEAPLAGDTNSDGCVNVTDLQALVVAWASQAGPPASSNWNAAADLNSDGYVNVGDLQVLVANWGRSN